MARNLVPKSVLLYYDGPELFTATDRLGTTYLCQAIVTEGSESRYLCAGISATRLREFKVGKIDLRTILTEPEVDELLLAHGNSDSETLVTEIIPASALREEWLPEPGLLFETLAEEDAVVSEAEQRNRAVVQLSLDEETTQDPHSVSVESLGRMLTSIQKMIKHAYRRAAVLTPASKREQIMHPANYTLEAFAYSPGSFRLHLQPKAGGDMFGYSEIEKALTTIDDTLVPLQSLEHAMQVLRPNRGHYLSALRSFLRLIIDAKLRVQYAWALPTMEISRKRIVDARHAEIVCEFLTKQEDLLKEMKEFTGNLSRADVETGRWALRDRENGQLVQGGCAPGVTLRGMVLYDVTYHFICEEVDREETVSGRETVELILQKHEIA